MGKLNASFEDHGDHLRVVAVIWPRRNGLPNTAAMQAAMSALETINPEAFDPPEPVSEAQARAALRDLPQPEAIELSANVPPVPVYEGDDMPGPRCTNGLCLGD